MWESQRTVEVPEGCRVVGERPDLVTILGRRVQCGLEGRLTLDLEMKAGVGCWLGEQQGSRIP